MRFYSKWSRPKKNVCWWRDGKQLAEGNFSRALYSLERRGLVERDQRQYGGYPHWKITKAGLDYYGYVPNLPPLARAAPVLPILPENSPPIRPDER